MTTIAATGVDERDIHERALALVGAHYDSAADRLVLLHACAMMIAAIAVDEADPIAAATKMISDQAAATLEFTTMTAGHPIRPRAVTDHVCPKCHGDCDPEWGCDQHIN